MAQACVTESLAYGIALHIDILHEKLSSPHGKDLLQLSEVMYCTLYFIKKYFEKHYVEFHHKNISCYCGQHVARFFNVINIIDRRITRLAETLDKKVADTYIENFTDCWLTTIQKKYFMLISYMVFSSIQM